jgi:hypothetical protein
MPNSPSPKTWRDVLPIHPAAELFPLMSEAELRELGEDIQANGLQAPIVPKIRQGSGSTQQSAEVSTEQRTAEHAALGWAAT